MSSSSSSSTPQNAVKKLYKFSFIFVDWESERDELSSNRKNKDEKRKKKCFDGVLSALASHRVYTNTRRRNLYFFQKKKKERNYHLFKLRLTNNENIIDEKKTKNK